MITVKYLKQIRTRRDIRGFHACLHATGLPLATASRTLGVLPALKLVRTGRRLSELYGL